MAKSKPPIVIDGCRIEQYAIRPPSVRFVGHGLLFRGGREVRSVPCLALGRDRGDGRIILLHCDGRWRSRVSSGDYATVREAKARAERFYPGISKAWRKTGYTARQARRFLPEGPTCSLCSKRWFDVEKIVVVGRAKIAVCDACIRQLHAMISRPDPRRRRGPGTS
jgi:hypothetical protein